MVKEGIDFIRTSKEGEGYREYPSPDWGLGFSQLQKRYFLDTPDFRFSQGGFSVREGVSVAPAKAMPSVWV
jgi:hypothetical protein